MINKIELLKNILMIIYILLNELKLFRFMVSNILQLVISTANDVPVIKRKRKSLKVFKKFRKYSLVKTELINWNRCLDGIVPNRN